MNEFYSFYDFCLLSEPSLYEGDKYKRSIHKNESLPRELIPESTYDRDCIVANIVFKYELAKQSWITYGDEGPPIGSVVMTLVSGHGGSAGCIRTFEGVFKIRKSSLHEYEYDPRYFALSRDGQRGKDLSLVDKHTWWNSIKVIG